jgi:hypothetical protein
MATRFETWRPSALAAACSPFALAGAAQVHLLGQPAVPVRVRTAPTNGLLPAGGAIVKINNYIGTVAAALPNTAAAEGATTSRKAISAASAPRVQTVQGDMVKGGNARGIPPRGTPV